MGSAAASAAVRCAPRRTLHHQDELSGRARPDGMPTARASLAAAEAGALPDSNCIVPAELSEPTRRKTAGRAADLDPAWFRLRNWRGRRGYCRGPDAQLRLRKHSPPPETWESVYGLRSVTTSAIRAEVSR